MKPKIKKATIPLCVLMLVALGLFLPLHQIQAQSWSPASAILGGMLFLIGAVLQIITLVTGGILAGIAQLLTWVTSGSFLSIPYTKLTMADGITPSIVGIGWPMVRDLTNMIFVIVLIFIGLATALRLKEYQVQKTLPVLIVIALLINFTPVICGLIVDASNVAMNFFLQSFSGGELFSNQMAIQNQLVESAVTGPNAWNPQDNWALVVSNITIIFFDILAAAVLAAYVLLFIVRYVAIWILVILSPLAFACYILPATRKIWSTWWNQFFQWCIVGIAGGFFLYLSAQMLQISAKMPMCPTATSAENYIGVLCGSLPFIITLAFLTIGFFISTSSGAIGASLAAGVGRTAGLKAGQLAAKWTGKGILTTGRMATGVAAGTVKGVTRGAMRGKKEYGMARGSGWTKKQALGGAMAKGLTELKTEVGRARPPRPDKGYRQAAFKGLKGVFEEFAEPFIGKPEGEKKRKKGTFARGLEAESKKIEGLGKTLTGTPKAKT